MTKSSKPLVLDLNQVCADDVELVGGKCASLGELFRSLLPRGVRAVDGFASTSEAYRLLRQTENLGSRLRELMSGLDYNDIRALNQAGRKTRALMLDTPLPTPVHEAIIDGYRRLCERLGRIPEVAVRSSATAEDLPDASFAGQQDTILNVRGEQQLIEACHHCFASLWTDRAISYRASRGFDHFEVALSIGIQPMVRADQACSGVMFTLDTESGFRDVVVINGAWGLGEAIVPGDGPLLSPVGISCPFQLPPLTTVDAFSPCRPLAWLREPNSSERRPLFAIEFREVVFAHGVCIKAPHAWRDRSAWLP